MAIKKFSTKIRVHWSDCDSAEIVYFPHFFRYFEIAEEELFTALGRPRWEFLHRLPVKFPRAEAWCRFRKPAREGDLIEVTTWIGKRTETSLVFQFEIRRDGDHALVAESHYRVVCVSRAQFQPAPWPVEVLDLLRDYLPPRTQHSPEPKRTGH